MDIHCPKCGEPWDSDELHLMPGSFERNYERFQREGCAVFETSCNFPGEPCRERPPLCSICRRYHGREVEHPCE